MEKNSPNRNSSSGGAFLSQISLVSGFFDFPKAPPILANCFLSRTQGELYEDQQEKQCKALRGQQDYFLFTGKDWGPGLVWQRCLRFLARLPRISGRTAKSSGEIQDSFLFSSGPCSEHLTERPGCSTIPDLRTSSKWAKMDFRVLYI